MIKDRAKELFKIDQFVNAVYVFDDKLGLDLQLSARNGGNLA